MPQYVLKIVVDMECRDDIEARNAAAQWVKAAQMEQAKGIRDIVLHSPVDHKSIHLKPDGTFDGHWNKGGR